ncbi:MAG: TA system VapC family ribonuclease toxin [Thermoguttaceae bacterium]|jgi:toxin-antitoxin system PIN domain toxin
MTTTAAPELAMLDTNVLVYAFDQQSNFHNASRTLLVKAADADSQEHYCVAPQILAEFFAVVTNPRRVHNPRTPHEALDVIERLMALPRLTILAVPIDVVARWVKLIRMHQVRSSAVFDTQLAATMQANGVRKIYTFDRAHFEHFSEIEIVTPQ